MIFLLGLDPDAAAVMEKERATLTMKPVGRNSVHVVYDSVFAPLNQISTLDSEFEMEYPGVPGIFKVDHLIVTLQNFKCL